MAELLQYSTPTRAEQFPTALRVVAWVFIAFGCLSVLDFILKLMHGQLFINILILDIFVGIGLLKRSRGWRTCGLVFIWILIAFTVFGGCVEVVEIFSVWTSPFRTSRPRSGEVIRLFTIATILVVSIWQYIILTRPDVRRLFGLRMPRAVGAQAVAANIDAMLKASTEEASPTAEFKGKPVEDEEDNREPN